MTDDPMPMSRRRFLAIVGSAGGAVGIAGLVGWRSTTSVSGESVAASAGEGVLAVEVESGFADAAGWKGDLLTLRPAGGPGGGMLLRAELSGTEHQVETPAGFAGRCVGAIGDTIVVCGHRMIETGRLNFEAGTDYRALIADAGPVAICPPGEPVYPQITSHTYVLVERFASVVTSADLGTWWHYDVPLVDGRGGSFGAVLGRGGVIAADRYAIAEVPDSVFETTLISLDGAAAGEATVVREPIPIDHGSLWGGADNGVSDLVIVSDRSGTKAYDNRGNIAFSLTDDSQLLGVDPAEKSLSVAVRMSSGRREMRRFSSGRHISSTMLADDSMIRHRIGPDVTIVAPDGKRSLISGTDIDRGRTPPVVASDRS